MILSPFQTLFSNCETFLQNIVSVLRNTHSLDTLSYVVD